MEGRFKKTETGPTAVMEGLREGLDPYHNVE
jgi:hypothetical protein